MTLEGITKRKQRSPNYPALSLEKAVELMGKLYLEFHKHVIPINIVYKTWGYAGGNGRAIRCLAAVKSFGLIEVQGKGNAKKVRISDDAHRIHLNAPDRDDVIKALALKPTIYADIWEHFKGNLPNEELLRNYLLWDIDPPFNELSASDFIAKFLETISFAKLTHSDCLVSSDTEDSIVEEELAESTTSDKKNNSPQSVIIKDAIPKLPSMNSDSFYDQQIPLMDGGVAVIRMPRPMSEENFDFLITFLQTIKPTIVMKKVRNED